MYAAAALLFSLPLAALAGSPLEAPSRRRHHASIARDISARGSSWSLKTNLNNSNFFDAFTWFTDADPTHGYVDFVSQSEAQQSGLATVNQDGMVILKVDNTNTLTQNPSQGGPGRKSIHIQSKDTYNVGSLIIGDFYAMPHGCATWPAFWMVGASDAWPYGGEIDIIEGVNDEDGNQISLHTGQGCTMEKTTQSSMLSSLGSVVNTDCQTQITNGQVTSNAGCNVHLGQPSYGHAFNMLAGGVYATEWTASGINVFFFPRNAIPQDITSGNPNPDSWGKPAAAFPNGGCDFTNAFKDQQIVFDITLCGDWAGGAYGSDNCPGDCASHVMEPSNFDYAQWVIGSVKVYTQN